MSTSTTKIAFPPPPPTTNSLTSHQRMQLLRTTNKLGRVLGSTPHLIDTSVVYMPGSLHRRAASQEDCSPSPISRISVDSVSSSSPSSPFTSRSTSVSFHTASSVRLTRSTPTTFRCIRSARSDQVKSCVRPPLLRIAFKSFPTVGAPTLETIPASPLSPRQSVFSTFSTCLSRRGDSSSEESADQDDVDTGHSTHPAHSPSPRDSLVSADPNFVIPTQNSIRRQKMDRLRRKLGDGIPLNLVFPKDPETEDEDEDEDVDEKFTPSSSPVLPVLMKDLPPLPPPVPRSPIPPSARIASRDSLVSPSPHRARRKPVPPCPSISVFTSPSSPSPSSPSCPSEKQHLCAIIESPDEHGSGCAAEFGFGSMSSHPYGSSGYYSSKSSLDSVSTASSVELEAESMSVRMWSTRRGYHGWLRRE